MTAAAGEPGLDARLRVALHPLDARLPARGWNHDELADLIAFDAPMAEAAVMVGLVHRTSGIQVILTRRNDGMRHHAGQVSFPGGRIEPDDVDAVAAALREAFEEIGVSPSQLRPLGLLDPLVTITGFRVVPVVVWVDPGYVAVPDPGEVAEVFEVPLDVLLDPAQLTMQSLEYKGRTRQVPEFLHRPQRIWGASALILLNLRQRLEAVP